MSSDANNKGLPLIPESVNTGQEKEEVLPVEIPSSQVPNAGRRRAFGDMRRELTADELSSPGVQKILYDELEKSEIELDELKEYVKAYHVADKRAAVLEEKQKEIDSIEVFFGVGVGLGGTIIGLGTFFWSISAIYGIICFLIGIALVIGSYLGRVIKQ